MEGVGGVKRAIGCRVGFQNGSIGIEVSVSEGCILACLLDAMVRVGAFWTRFWTRLGALVYKDRCREGAFWGCILSSLGTWLGALVLKYRRRGGDEEATRR